MPKCPICKKEYKRAAWLMNHLLKFERKNYSVSGNSIAKKRTVSEFIE